MRLADIPSIPMVTVRIIAALLPTVPLPSLVESAFRSMPTSSLPPTGPSLPFGLANTTEISTNPSQNLFTLAAVTIDADT